MLAPVVRLFPEAWPPYRRSTRRYLLHRFPFSLVYRIDEDDAVVYVVAVAHAKQRPEYGVSEGSHRSLRDRIPLSDWLAAS